MKLVEILAREIHEWPDGQLWASQDPDKEIRFDEDPIHDFYVSTLADDAGQVNGGGARVTREMWEAERSRIKNAEWDGQGLPEPGADIEFLGSEKVWKAGKYIGMFDGQIIAGCKETGAIVTVSRENIRPAKSEAEKERQAVIREMMETVCKGAPWTLSADAAAKLYDAGYRKIVAPK